MLHCRAADVQVILEVFALNCYDLPGIDWLRAETILDVGAHVGATTVWMAHRAPRSRIISIEPSPASTALLLRNVRDNHLLARVEVMAAALSDSEAWACIATGAAPGETQLRHLGGNEGPIVRTTSLEQLLEDRSLSIVDIVKLDCEGSEFEIIGGAPPDVLRRVRTFVGEYHASNGHNRDELSGHFNSAGFVTTFEGTGPTGLFTATRGR
ncbi:MAG: FkbM family methyltransferase [Candidatus Dormibacteraeota bacterium]|nr:FkbM family methyltransferase [Candidatus Dormibacteraeota bacterium]